MWTLRPSGEPDEREMRSSLDVLGSASVRGRDKDANAMEISRARQTPTRTLPASGRREEGVRTDLARWWGSSTSSGQTSGLRLDKAREHEELEPGGDIRGSRCARIGRGPREVKAISEFESRGSVTSCSLDVYPFVLVRRTWSMHAREKRAVHSSATRANERAGQTENE
jgi:hypothetical protein